MFSPLPLYINLDTPSSRHQRGLNVQKIYQMKCRWDKWCADNCSTIRSILICNVYRLIDVTTSTLAHFNVVSLNPELRIDAHNPLEPVSDQWVPMHHSLKGKQKELPKAATPGEGERKRLEGNLNDCFGKHFQLLKRDNTFNSYSLKCLIKF